MEESSDKEQLEAFKAVLRLEQLDIQELCVVVAGLDKIVERQKKEDFVHDILAFIFYLQSSPRRVKTLLTSQPLDEFKISLGRLPSIEHDKERKECLSTLRFDNTRYHKITPEHEGSLEWLWTHEKYLNWISCDRSRLLYIQGKPGSGKSTLTNLMSREPNANPAVAIVASLFYSFREGEPQKSHYNMLRTILYDILNQDESYFRHFQRQYREYYKLEKQRYSDLHMWHYESLKRVLLSMGDFPRLGRLYLIIDGVDESTDKDRCDVLRLLFKLCADASCTIKVFVASRPVAELNHFMAKSQVSGIIRMQDMNESDIRSFVDSFLPEIDFPDHILQEATEYIVEHAQGVFLWVRLVRDRLAVYSMKGSTKARIFDFLKGLPQELEGIYNLILWDLCQGDSDDDGDKDEDDIADGVKMFRLVLFTRRPLTITELQHCLAIPDHPDAEFVPSIEAFERHNILGIQNRIAHCGGNLLECKDGISAPQNGTVQVMHQSVSEFFLRPDGSAANSQFRMISHDAHTTIVTTCIRYIIYCSALTNPYGEYAPLSIENWATEDFETYIKYLDDRPLINYALSHLRDHV
ncbi:hypothetical protein K440DRAFT_679197, partial [Wilcoxina mikolae CBS 423.85]